MGNSENKSSEKKPLSPYAQERLRAVRESEGQEKIGNQVVQTQEKVGGILGKLRKFFSWRPVFGEDGVKNIPVYPEEKISLGLGRLVSNPIRKIFQMVAKVVFGVLGAADEVSRNGVKGFGKYSSKLGPIGSVDTSLSQRKKGIVRTLSQEEDSDDDSYSRAA